MQLFYFVLCCAFIFFGFSDTAEAQGNSTWKEVYEIKTEQIIQENLINYALVYADCSQKKDFIEILQQQESFSPYSDTVSWSPDCVYWVKITIANTLPHEWDWMFYLGKDINLVSVFDPLSNIGEYVRKDNGIFVPPSERNVDELVSDAKVRLNFFPKSQKTIFIRYQNINNRPIRVDLKLIKKDEFGRQVKYRNLSQGIFQGLVWIMVFYNFLIFILNKERVYLYYSLYLLGTAFFLGVMTSLALDGIHGEIFHFIWYLGGLCVAFYFLFMRSFLRTDLLFPRLDKAITWAIRIQFGVVIFVMIYHFTYDIALIALLYFLSIAVQALFILVLLVVLLVLLFRKKGNNKLIYFFVAGSFALILGAASGNVINWFELAPRVVSGLFIQAGIIAEILLFSMGLGYRMKLNEREKQDAQQKLITQLQENEKLQLTLNQELEQKVKERTKEIETQKEHIEEANKKMTDSITYAARIQKAILGDVRSLEVELGQEAFILFRPRDIVSGDFYWYKKLETKTASYKILVIADCTGHGVPGAFMTVMGVDLLEQIVNNDKIWKPHHLLYELDKFIKIATTQRNSSGRQIRDGMDMVVLVFEEGTNKAYFAGAKNPLFHIRETEAKLTKGSRSAIGGVSRKTKTFEMHTITYQKDDVFYLYSDGYQDQFGGEKGMKFMSKVFRQKLFEISSLPMKEQKEILNQMFIDWKGNYSQTDDVLLAGIKV